MFPQPKHLGKSEEELEHAAQLGLRYPLDADQLPRLYNLRLARANDCKCERCGDLLENLHTKTKLLEIAHSAESPGLAFWTQVPPEGTPAHFETALGKKMKLTPKELTRHDEFLDTLVEVEHNWQRSQSSACLSDDTDNFWLNHYAEMARHIEELRRFDEESLEKMRSAALKKMESTES